MKKILPLIVVMSFALGAWAQQSLGEIARRNRAKKKPASIISLNDDNMPRTLTTNPDDDSANDTDKPAVTANSDNKKEAADSAKEKKEENGKLADEIKKQKDQVSQLQHELDIAQREQRLNAAAFYGDAGVQLRDQAKFAEESRKKQEEIDGKKKAIDAAQQKLSDLEEQARKAGLPSSE
jgi:hypothetical protein